LVVELGGGCGFLVVELSHGVDVGGGGGFLVVLEEQGVDVGGFFEVDGFFQVTVE